MASWLRAHLIAAQAHAQALVDSLPAATEELVGLCADEARARLMASACMTEGSREDCPPKVAREWREEARAWAREVRQTVLTRKAVARETPAEDFASDLRQRQAAFQKQLSERQMGGQR